MNKPRRVLTLRGLLIVGSRNMTQDLSPGRERATHRLIKLTYFNRRHGLISPKTAIHFTIARLEFIDQLGNRQLIKLWLGLYARILSNNPIITPTIVSDPIIRQ